MAAQVERFKEIISKAQQPKQKQFNELYRKIYKFMRDKWKKARRENRKCVFTMGESHTMSKAQNSFVVEKMVMMVARRLGINTLIMEGNPHEIESAQELVKLTGRGGTNVWSHLMADPIAKYFRIVPAEKGKTKRSSLASPAVYEKMEAQMRGTIAKEISRHDAVIVTVGIGHLLGVSDESYYPEFRSKNILFVPISTCTPEGDKWTIKALRENILTATKHEIDAVNFMTDPSRVAKFFIDADLSTISTEKLPLMVDKADKAFDSKRSIRGSSARIQTELSSASSQTVPVSIVTTSLPAASVSGKLLADTPVTASLPEPRYPTETIPPLSVLAQIGFWAASKLGWCASPSATSLDVATSLPSDLRAEMAADKTLNQQGSSLEASLHHLFGKFYTKGDATSKAKYKKFVVDVVNGNVDKATGKKFNELAQISNAHERAKQVSKLWRSVTGETRADRHARRHRM